MVYSIISMRFWLRPTEVDMVFRIAVCALPFRQKWFNTFPLHTDIGCDLLLRSLLYLFFCAILFALFLLCVWNCAVALFTSGYILCVAFVPVCVYCCCFACFACRFALALHWLCIGFETDIGLWSPYHHLHGSLQLFRDWSGPNLIKH